MVIQVCPCVVWFNVTVNPDIGQNMGHKLTVAGHLRFVEMVFFSGSHVLDLVGQWTEVYLSILAGQQSYCWIELQGVKNRIVLWFWTCYLMWWKSTQSSLLEWIHLRNSVCSDAGSKKRGGDQALGEQSWRFQDNKKSRHAAPSLGRPGVVVDPALSIYVKNLPFSATEDELADFFSRCGTVVRPWM